MQNNLKSGLFFPISIICFIWIINPLFAYAFSGSNNDEVSALQMQVDILHYNFKIQLNSEEKSINCESEITALSINPDLNEIELNLYDNLEVTNVLMDGRKVEFFRRKNRIFIKSYKNLTDTFKIFIKYNGKPQRAGFDGFVFGEVNGTTLIYNISEPTYAATWFVCDDDPADKALLDIEITNDSQFVSVSNGKLESIKNYDGQKIYHYKTIYPISTYLIAVYSAPYLNYHDDYAGLDGKDSMKIEYYVLPEHLKKSKVDFAKHTEMIKVFSELFGEYPFIKEKYGVAEFLWNFGAMENQTITGIGYNFLSGNDFFKDTYVHELAHHWWGNSVSPKSWDDIWLNEGFATYCEALYAEAKYGKSALISKMMSKFSKHFSGTLYAPKNLFGSTVYDKGAWILHMLRFEIGDSCFFRTLRDYYTLYKYSNASVEDFKNVCERTSGKNLDKFFDQWIYIGEDIPECDYSYSIEKKDGKIFCSFKIIQVQEQYAEFHFPLEIRFKFDDGNSFIKKMEIESREQTNLFELPNETFEMTLDPDNNLLAVFNNRGTN
jgi:aminopeptidase N